MKLTKEKALEILDGDVGEILDQKIIGNSRWSIYYDIIVKLDDRFYRATYSVGATEMQDESPWQYEKEIEFREVEPIQVNMTIYVEKK